MALSQQIIYRFLRRRTTVLYFTGNTFSVLSKMILFCTVKCIPERFLTMLSFVACVILFAYRYTLVCSGACFQTIFAYWFHTRNALLLFPSSSSRYAHRCILFPFCCSFFHHLYSEYKYDDRVYKKTNSVSYEMKFITLSHRHCM